MTEYTQTATDALFIAPHTFSPRSLPRPVDAISFAALDCHMVSIGNPLAF
jgi:hypothetical protein